MLIMAFAFVPIYRIFCQKTGFAGTPKINPYLSDRIVNRVIEVEFNSDLDTSLPWRFKPLQRSIKVKLGESGLAFYEVINNSGATFKGMATYNVTPDKAAVYFNKVACFCFEEQIILPFQKRELPVQFYIDPTFDDDKYLKDVHKITLSYTFFPLKSNEIYNLKKEGASYESK